MNALIVPTWLSGDIYRLLLINGWQIFVTTLKVLEGEWISDRGKAKVRYSVTFQNLKGCGKNICPPFMSNNLYPSKVLSLYKIHYTSGYKIYLCNSKCRRTTSHQGSSNYIGIKFFIGGILITQEAWLSLFWLSTWFLNSQLAFLSR